jgi:hypothetical protein
MKNPSIRTALIVAPILIMSAGNGIADQSRWTMTRGDEDWGKFCMASYKAAEGIELGFHGSPDGYVAAYLDLKRDTYPDEIDTRWQVDGGASYSLRGGVSDYFGYPELELLDNSLLIAVAGGTVLTVSVGGSGPLRIPLAGSDAALKGFQSCMSE